MKKTLLFTLLIFCLTSSFLEAHRMACRTNDGKNVVLDSNNTWNYFSGEVYKKSDKAKKFFKSNRVNYGVWVDSDLWTSQALDKKEDVTEFKIKLKNDLISAEIRIDDASNSYALIKKTLLDEFSELDFEISNMKEVDCIVNNLLVKRFEFDCKSDDCWIRMFGQIYIEDNATIFICTSATKNKLELKEVATKELFDGLVQLAM